MTKTLRTLGAVGGLGLSIIPAFLFWNGSIGDAFLKGLLVAGMILWFASALMKPQEGG